MRILITEDDPMSRRVMSFYLSKFGDCDLAEDGQEAVDAVRQALDDGAHYDLICLDVMMPNMDGQEALAEIRVLEKDSGIEGDQGAKIIMTTALSDGRNQAKAFMGDANAYLIKPIQKDKLEHEMNELGFTARDA